MGRKILSLSPFFMRLSFCRIYSVYCSLNATTPGVQEFLSCSSSLISFSQKTKQTKNFFATHRIILNSSKYKQQRKQKVVSLIELFAKWTAKHTKQPKSKREYIFPLVRKVRQTTHRDRKWKKIEINFFILNQVPFSLSFLHFEFQLRAELVNPTSSTIQFGGK